jgi:hypothetical protein
MGLRVAFVPGVTPSKWFRTWSERFPSDPVEPVPLDVVALGAVDPLDVLFTSSSAVPDARSVPPSDSDAVPANPDAAEPDSTEPDSPEPDSTEPDAAASDAAGPADVVIARLPVAGEGVHSIALYEEQPVVVVSRDHEITAVAEISLDELTTLLDGRMQQVAPTPTGGREAVELVAAGVGAVLLPQSLARLWSRKDVDSRPVTGAPTTTVALVWRTDLPPERAALVEEFVGVVRGRTANSSRAPGSEEPPVKQRPTAKAKARAAEARAAEARTAAARKKTVAPGRTRPRRPRAR